MLARFAILAIGLTLLLPAPAGASLAGEQRQGQNLVTLLQSGTETCRSLSAGELDRVGEYLMFRALGSTALHRVMNERMIATLGDRGESRMHRLLGARYTGCTDIGSGAGGSGNMMGADGMRGGYYETDGGFGAMMGSSSWSWMMARNWQDLTRPDWRRLQHQLLGADAGTYAKGGWSPTVVLVAVFGTLLLSGVAIVAALRHLASRPPAASTRR